MSDFRLRIIAEGPSDVHIIRKLLFREPVSEMKFYAAQGKVSAVTVARNILVHEGGPVLLVVDSDTLDIARQQEYEQTALAAIEASYGRDYMTVRPNFMVFSFRPCIEVVFFEAPDALGQLVKEKTDERTIEEGKARPKQLLRMLSGIKESAWLEILIRKIDAPIRDLLAAGDQAKKLRETAQSLMHAVAQ